MALWGVGKSVQYYRLPSMRADHPPTSGCEHPTMKFPIIVAAVLALPSTYTQYVCPAMPAQVDITALRYAYTIQELLN